MRAVEMSPSTTVVCAHERKLLGVGEVPWPVGLDPDPPMHTMKYRLLRVTDGDWRDWKMASCYCPTRETLYFYFVGDKPDDVELFHKMIEYCLLQQRRQTGVNP